MGGEVKSELGCSTARQGIGECIASGSDIRRCLASHMFHWICDAELRSRPIILYVQTDINNENSDKKSHQQS